MEYNKQKYQQYVEGFLQKGDETVADLLVAEDVVTHDGMPGQASGLAGVKSTFRILHTAFPDLKADMQDIIAEGDKVVGRFVVSGTHSGSFMGMPATGKSFSYDEIVIVRFKDGKIAEHWAEMDSMGFMQQLGMM